jgi:uncharacterized protein YqjF (DUF2071 family)
MKALKRRRVGAADSTKKMVRFVYPTRWSGPPMPAATVPTDPIDRLAPTRRPPGRAVMRQNWHHLLFLHWVVSPDLLRPLVLPGLDLDLFEGRAYVGLVPFTMTEVRPVWAPAVPGLSSFHETNVRTYVHHAGRDPGVWFFSLDAANRVAVALARALFHLPYYYARMRLTLESQAIAYASERLRPRTPLATCSIRCAAVGPVVPAKAGTLEHFLVERYLLYAAHRGRLYRGQVHHTPYPLQRAEVSAFDETLIVAAGIPRPDEAPIAHFAQGVCVEVFGLTQVG